MDFEHQGYRCTNVYQRLSADQRQEIIGFWVQYGAMPPSEAKRRVAEVVYVFRNSDGVLVGVNTVYIRDFIKKGNPYYFYRIFVRPEDRGHINARAVISRKTRDFLKGYDVSEGAPRGVAFVAENQKLTGKAARRMLQRAGWHYFGKGARGFDVWYENFDGNVITY